jgi:hypothetical protein
LRRGECMMGERKCADGQMEARFGVQIMYETNPLIITFQF